MSVQTLTINSFTMKKNKLVGTILIIVGIMTISGMLVKNDLYWLIIDLVVIITCLSGGLYLLLKKQ